jgi:hypothetical protein
VQTILGEQDTPASSVVIAGLEHPGEEPYSIAEYKNLVGRAGRLGYAEKGTSFLLALDGRKEYDFWGRYVEGTPEDLVSRFLDEDTDPRSLIVRVLVAAQRAAGKGVATAEIVDFLEASFGAFQASNGRENWQWNRDDLLAALNDLRSHKLIELGADDLYQLTALGRLAGETATEVETIVRFVNGFSLLGPDDITDPALVTAVQTAAELDQVLFPMNKKSTQKEPQLWPAELRQQGISGWLIGALGQFVTDSFQSTLRAKKAVACLLFVSGRPMTDIERIVTQFGGASGGAAGPVRAVAARTCDLLPTAARVAEILHPTLDLGDRVGRLTTRLMLGIPGPAVALARVAGSDLLRGDYCRLAIAGLCSIETINAADDQALLACVDNDRRKVALIRRAVLTMSARQDETPLIAGPLLDAYVA